MHVFVRIECINTPNRWNGIEIHILSLLEQDMIGIIFNWDISTTHPSPNPSAPPPPPLRKKAIKRDRVNDRVNFVVLNTVNNSKFLFLKTRKAN